ncbi:MAG TPA: hypothetical protein VJ754_07225, partial [Anaerolineae bacterium]|nr:hypothetical protein [Anaerolineae bacterium]
VDVALVDAAGVPVDVSSGLLGPAWYSAVSWRVGEVVATLAVLRVPPRQAPGTYYLQVAVRDRAGQTLAGEGPIERPGLFSLWTERIQARQTAWRLGEVSVTARNRNFVAPAVQYPLAVTFGDQIRLVGYDLDVSEARPGGHLRITFVWQALRSTEQNHVVFTHLRDAGGVLRGQRDSMPVGGSNPTPYWETGEVVVDTYLIAIDPAAPPGRHTLGFGWYESDSGTRLAAVAADGTRWRDDIVLIGDLPVAAPAAP